MLLDLLLENIAAARHTAAAFDLAADTAADMAFDTAVDTATARAVDLERARAGARAGAASLSIRLLKHQPIYHIGIGQPATFLFFFN